MNSQKQFTGFLSSVAAPGSLSLTIASLTQALLWGAGAFAVMRGLDVQTVTSNVQIVIDYVATGITAGLTIYHTGQALWGVLRKLWYMAAAKQVVTTPVAVPTAVTTAGETVA